MAELAYTLSRFYWTERRKLFAAIALLTMLAFVAYFAEPGKSRFLPPCMLHSLTGLHCPGCGMTRSMHALMHGRAYEAFRFNPLFVICIPVFARLFVDWTVRTLGNRPPRRAANQLHSRWIQCILALVILYWIARNIRVYPFTLLAPQ